MHQTEKCSTVFVQGNGYCPLTYRDDHYWDDLQGVSVTRSGIRMES